MNLQLSHQVYSNDITVQPNQISLYATYHGRTYSREGREKSLANLRNNDHKGLISSSTRRRVTSYINWIIAQAKHKAVYDRERDQWCRFKVGFITLTLPSRQMHSDQEIKARCLNQWLVEMRKLNRSVKYLWRAERQGNGSIHFHVLVDVYYDHRMLRDDWNRIIGKLGYIDRYSDKMKSMSKEEYVAQYMQNGKRSRAKAEAAWIQGRLCQWSRPNSTDVHAIKNVRNIAAYISKYCTKNDSNKAVMGRLWGCDVITGSMARMRMTEGEYNRSDIDRLLERKDIRVYTSEFCTTLSGPIAQILSQQKTSIGSEYRRVIRSLQTMTVKELRESRQVVPIHVPPTPPPPQIPKLPQQVIMRLVSPPALSLALRTIESS